MVNFMVTYWRIYILLYNVVRVSCLKLTISITAEPIGFSILDKFHVGSIMVLGYFIFRFESWDGLKLWLFECRAPRCRDVTASNIKLYFFSLLITIKECNIYKIMIIYIPDFINTSHLWVVIYGNKR